MTAKKIQWHTIPGVIGVRYREHPERKFLRKPDRYFSIRYKVRDAGVVRAREEGVGWASEGYTAQKAAELRAAVLQKIDEVGRPYSLAELRAAHQEGVRDRAARTALQQQREVTFAQACERYLVWAQSNKRSWALDASRIAVHLRPFLGAYRLVDITPPLIAALHLHLQQVTGRVGTSAAKPLSASTIKQLLQLVSRIFSQARLLPLRDDLPQVPLFSGENPCRDIRLPRPTAARWRILSAEQEQDVLQCSLDLRIVGVRKRYPTINHAMVFHDAILFALRTGARLGEVCGLRWPFVDTERNVIRLTETKGGRDRTVFADADVLDMLKRRQVHDPVETHVFWDVNRPMPTDRLTRAFKAVVDHLGLNAGYSRDEDRIVFHSLRHTYGTRAIMDGMNPLLLKKLMGHRTLETTERYVHLAEEFMRAGALRGAAVDHYTAR